MPRREAPVCVPQGQSPRGADSSRHWRVLRCALPWNGWLCVCALTRRCFSMVAGRADSPCSAGQPCAQGTLRLDTRGIPSVPMRMTARKGADPSDKAMGHVRTGRPLGPRVLARAFWCRGNHESLRGGKGHEPANVRVCFGRSEVPLSRRAHLERGGVRRRGEVNLSQVIDSKGGGEASWRAVAHQAGG